MTPPLTPKDRVAAFIKRLNALDPEKSPYDKFRDFCEMGFCAFAKLTAPTPAGVETVGRAGFASGIGSVIVCPMMKWAKISMAPQPKIFVREIFRIVGYPSGGGPGEIRKPH